MRNQSLGVVPLRDLIQQFDKSFQPNRAAVRGHRLAEVAAELARVMRC